MSLFNEQKFENINICDFEENEFQFLKCELKKGTIFDVTVQIFEMDMCVAKDMEILRSCLMLGNGISNCMLNNCSIKESGFHSMTIKITS